MKIGEILKKVWREMVRFFTRDWLRKGIALIFAVAVFVIFARQPETGSRDLLVKVETPSDLINHSDTISVKVFYQYDRRANADELNATRGTIIVDSAKFVPNTKYFTTLTKENFNLPRGFNITRIEPAEIELNLERGISKKVRVEPNLNLKERLPRDYQIDLVTVVPAEIEIFGGESLVKQIDSLSTRALPLNSSVTENFNCDVEVNYPKGVEGITKKVQAKVVVNKYLGTRKFSNLPLAFMYSGNTPEHFRPVGELPMVEVILEGPVKQLNSLRSEVIRPYLDLSNISKKGDYTLNVNCLVGNVDGVILVRSIEPKEIKIKLK